MTKKGPFFGSHRQEKAGAQKGTSPVVAEDLESGDACVTVTFYGFL